MIKVEYSKAYVEMLDASDSYGRTVYIQVGPFLLSFTFTRREK